MQVLTRRDAGVAAGPATPLPHLLRSAGIRAGVGSAAAVVLGLCTWAVLRPGPGNWLIVVDTKLRHRFIGPADDPLRRLAHAVIVIGDVRVAVPAAAVTAIGVALVRRSWRPVLVTGVAVGLLGASVTLLKDAVGRAGPGQAVYPFVHVGGTAYPSGHTATAVVCFGLVALQLAVLWPAARAWALAAAVVLPAAVSAAFIYTPGHWFSDVVAGWAVGALILVCVPSPVRPRPTAPA